MSGVGMVFHWSCCPRPARKPVVKARCLSAYLLVCSLLLTLCPVGKVTNKGVESWLWSYSCAVCVGVTWGHSSTAILISTKCLISITGIKVPADI